MSSDDLRTIYKEYANWQSDYAHGKSGKTVKSMMDAIDRAKHNIIDDVEDIVSHFYKEGKFDTRADALAYLNQPMDLETKKLLKESISKIEDPEERTRQMWRMSHRSETLDKATNRGALMKIVENTIKDVYNRINGVMQNTLSNTIKESASRSMFTLQKGCRAGWSFQQPNKRQIGALMKSVYNSEVAENFAKQHADTVKAILVGGVASGTPVGRIAHQISAETSAELWKAKRLVRTELTKAGNIGEAFALQSAGIERYEFSCTLDEKTCPVCGSMDGKVFELSKSQMGYNYPPMHPNCRCWTHAALTRSVQEKMTRSHRDPKTGKTDYIPMSMKYDDWAKQYLGIDVSRNTDVPEYVPSTETPNTDKVIEALDSAGVEYKTPEQFDDIPTEDEIISRIGGGDLTRGSCSSVAFTYAGNKGGYDVLDFRGGKSMEYFSSWTSLDDIAKIEDLEVKTVEEYNENKIVNQLLLDMEPDKEYYIAVGQHAAIVKKDADGGYKYLELQQPTGYNGYKPVIADTFSQRFGCKKSRTCCGQKILNKGHRISVESLSKSKGFLKILGYINTAQDKQKKGEKGRAK